MAILCVAMFSSTAHSWGWATHAYIDDALNKADDERNMNEIYGGIAPDMFNYYFAETDEVRDEIFNQFHYDFMNIWNRKKTGQEKALAYGFVSHNELWGADMTAHKSGITFGESEDGEPEGYVVTWAKILAQNAPLEVYLPGIPEDLAMQLYHTFVEYGLDILTVRLDPAIGTKILSATVNRDEKFLAFMADTFAESLAASDAYEGSEDEARQLFYNAETLHKYILTVFGNALAQPEEEDRIASISWFLAAFASDFLPGELPPPEVLVNLVKGYLGFVIANCEGSIGDYFDELFATITYLDEELDARGFTNRQYKDKK